MSPPISLLYRYKAGLLLAIQFPFPWAMSYSAPTRDVAEAHAGDLQIQKKQTDVTEVQTLHKPVNQIKGLTHPAHFLP
jgi:hypothetical protein